VLVYNAEMKNKQVRILEDTVKQRFLPFVRRPSRYIGGEVNQIKKDLAACDVKVALCFPDIYEIGMSHTGMAIIYHVINKQDRAVAERVFAPWADAEEILRKENIPLFTLESKAAVKDFDIIGFSLTNELCYGNMLNMLDMAGLEIRAENRTEDDPLVIVGGQASNCGEPIADFVDVFVLGEGEDAIVELIELVREQKKASAGKRDILLEIAKRFDFAYVPSLYDFDYEQGKIKTFHSKKSDLRERFENAIIADMDSVEVPGKVIVPFAQAVHERVSVEIMRGCPGRCRFCQASFCRRPVRYRSVERIVEIAKETYKSTGFDTVSLLSLSTADYPELKELAVRLREYFDSRHVGLSLPSLRVKEQLKLLPELTTSVRKGGLTIAVEAASEKLRRVINKPISDDDLFAGVEAAYQAGFRKVKLYFMVGLPGETIEDIERIPELAYEIARLRKKVDNKTANVNIGISWLVPKPHTTLGWLGQKRQEYFENAKGIILQQKRKLNAKFLQFKFHGIGQSVLESAIARGDRRIGKVIESAWRNGARFDLWDECFDYEIWKNAFAGHGMDIDLEAQKDFDQSDTLPWSHLGGAKKDYLLGHFNEAITAAKS